MAALAETAKRGPKIAAAGAAGADLPGDIQAVQDALVRAHELWRRIEAEPGCAVTVDLERREVRAGELVCPFTLDDETRSRLLDGVDQISATLRYADDIAAYERRRRPLLPRSDRGRTTAA